jgi:PAS domain S-box-containing protein
VARRARPWFRLPLAGKLTLVATATSALPLTILAAILGWSDAVNMRGRIVNDTRVLVDMIGASSPATLLFGDAKAAAETVKSAGVSEHVITAALILPNGEVLARYDRHQRRNAVVAPIDAEALLQRGQWHAFRDDSLVMTSPIVFDNAVVGAAYVELSLDDLWARRRSLTRTMALTLTGTLALAGLIGWWLQRIVSRPLLRLTAITKAVTRQHTYDLRAAKTTDDEIGELVVGFNEMLDDLQRRDVTLEQHRQELERTVESRTAELKASVERFKMLVESTRAVPWEIDGSGFRFSYISPQATNVFGYSSDRLVREMSFLDLVHPDDRDGVARQLAALQQAGAGPELDIDCRVITARDGVLDVHSVVGGPGGSDGSAAVLRGITVDVTRHKKLEFELRQAQKLESVGRLAAGVAHEINTPVQFVSDSVHFLRDAMQSLLELATIYRKFRAELGDRPPAPGAMAIVDRAEEDADLEYLMEHVPKALDRSLEGLNRVAVIVRSMKEFAHPDQREMSVVDLNKAIQSTLIIARNEYKYVADVETDLGDVPMVRCHGGDINQALLNIIVNAAHAIGDVVGQSGTKGRIAVRTRREDDHVAISIADTGPGIPEDVRELVFDPFFTTKGVGRGTGQGLAITRSIVCDKHKGDLSFETRMGLGTTFTIRLPIDGYVEAEHAA